MIDFQSSLTGVAEPLPINQNSTTGMSSPGGTSERGERHYICCSNSNERSECRFVCCSSVGERCSRGRQSALIHLRVNSRNSRRRLRVLSVSVAKIRVYRCPSVVKKNLRNKPVFPRLSKAFSEKKKIVYFSWSLGGSNPGCTFAGQSRPKAGRFKPMQGKKIKKIFLAPTAGCEI